MSVNAEYLVHAYIADRHREARLRLRGPERDTSRQKVQRAKSDFPYGATTAKQSQAVPIALATPPCASTAKASRTGVSAGNPTESTQAA